jgi:hypothetical protein
VRHPEDRDILLALATFSRDARNFPAALDYAERLARLAPGDREITDLVARLRRSVSKPDAQ